jgi:hypothetical protein
VIRTYLDAGVLTGAVRRQQRGARFAYDVLEEPEREFVASVFLRLDVLPKAVYQRRIAEVEFYERFFARIVAWAEPIEELVARAEREAARYGLSALDALHVTAARMLGADEFVTTERQGKPIHRVMGMRVIAISP